MLTHEYLLERLSYDPETGVFTWLPLKNPGHYEKIWNTRYAGTRPGTPRARGYRYINLHKKNYAESHLAWFYMTGRMPEHEIDHINGITSDNRFSNLREATSSQNKVNRCAQSTSRSGIKGVRFKKGKWLASIKVNGRSKHLGSFDSAESASTAFKRAAIRLHGDFAKL